MASSLYKNNYYYPPPPPPLPPPPAGSMISPAVLFIIVILAALFFISGLLHLLVRFLKKKRPISSPERWSSEAALQRQLQQLFHLHDSGLDQASIDALPAFRYADVVGPKHPFDCAVCLSEFSPDDSLRLLPTCSHAFHVSCIDTWLLSNSTCPICRAALVDNPVFDYDAADDYLDDAEAAAEIHLDAGPDPTSKGVLQLQVKLGKFRKLDVEEDPGFVHHEASDSNLDARRCYSMGSYQYVVGNTNLRVALCPPHHKLSPDGNKIISSVSRGDSYSVSKIWLWQKKGSSSGGGGGPGDARIDLPSFNTEYPWIDRTPNDV